MVASGPARLIGDVAAIRIDPERLAHLEAAGWRAYYDHHWPKLIGLMVQLNQAHRFSYDRDALVKMLDETLARIK